MKALVLTYDRNRIVTDHMVACYHDLWPDHPFVFRIPYQDKALNVETNRREYVRTSPEIKDTILRLMDDLDDEEWVYWCIDDKYPIQLNLERVKTIQALILQEDPKMVDAILYCRARNMLRSEFLLPDRLILGDVELLERKAYHQIWIHQFVRTKVIRHLFQSFPDQLPAAGVMDPLKDQVVKPAGHRLFVTSVNHATFGESTLAGSITANCAQSILAKGFSMPEWQTGKLASSTIIGSEV